MSLEELGEEEYAEGAIRVFGGLHQLHTLGDNQSVQPAACRDGNLREDGREGK